MQGEVPCSGGGVVLLPASGGERQMPLGPSFFSVGSLRGNGCQPLGPSFCDQKEAKSPTVSTRWTPTRVFNPVAFGASSPCTGEPLPAAAGKRWPHSNGARFLTQPLAAFRDRPGKKSPHRAGAGQKQRCFTSSFPRPDGRAGPRRPAYTGCPGHGRTCRSRGGSCRGLPPTADGRGRGGYTPQSRSHGRRAGSR